MKYFVPPTREDIEYVATNMRPEDVEECHANGQTPLYALTVGVNVSRLSFALVDDNRVPVAILGVTEGISKDWGLIWLLGTPGIETNQLKFLRHCRYGLKRMFEESGFEVFYNYTYAKNDVHHRWLRWLGFSFLRKLSLPPHNEEFYEFARLKD